MKELKSLVNLKSKSIFITLALIYLLACYILSSDLISFFKILIDEKSLSYLGFFLSLISLTWIYDTKQAINHSGRKNKLLNIVLLIDKIISRNLTIESYEFIDLYSEIRVLKPSAVLTAGDGKSSLELNKMEIEKLDGGICFSINELRNDPAMRAKKISEHNDLFVALTVYKKMIELDIMETKFEEAQ